MLLLFMKCQDFVGKLHKNVFFFKFDKINFCRKFKSQSCEELEVLEE